MSAFLSDDPDYPCTVVVNEAGDRSLWPRNRDIPPGWRAAGFSGTRAHCLAHIEGLHASASEVSPS
ncbi:MbtH family protein [Marinactinospora thermotolerans]|uniref:MbtH protein n=1 Tax=Marinactinospora thermotolerans DSM 45154 TaxID=1122192 RepID=A0A1T4KJ53_9ACTN|nr:MbtH family protein [Marinactinospora thermotolerans]SJZ42430.1 MbtH protein [Marinactinospora thermotolerans DSM 45154]